MVKWKKLNKKVAGVLLGVMVLFSASTTAFAYVDPSAETTNTEAAQTETVQNKETEKPADEGVLPENNKTEKKEDAFTEPVLCIFYSKKGKIRERIYAGQKTGT